MNVKNERELLKPLKTETALHTAMYTILERCNFKKVTVRHICEEALVSRAAFYAHYTDKFDFLKQWLIGFWPGNFDTESSYDQWAKDHNPLLKKNERIIKNVLDSADIETLNVVSDSLLALIRLNSEPEEMSRPGYVTITNFYAGGMLWFLMWQVNNRFPEDVLPMNLHLYDIIKFFQTMGGKQEDATEVKDA